MVTGCWVCTAAAPDEGHGKLEGSSGGSSQTAGKWLLGKISQNASPLHSAPDAPCVLCACTC